MAIDYLSQFDSFKKSFLLKKPPEHSDRKKLEKSIELTRTQTAPETQAKRTEGDSILHYIRYLRNTFGPASKEDARPILYAEAAKLFKRVEK
jgi:DNA replicative helicase MCM subunit Mcm2 (Cdc46/Mcm family)